MSAPDLLAPRLQEWLSSRFSESTIEIIRTEKAVLPMGLKIAHPSYATPQYTYGGQAAGAIRPATGYAFLRIQRWARDCANQIAEGKTIKAPRLSPWIVRAMDALFLAVLHDQPQRGALLFQALAQRVPPAVLVRFLSDEANIIDYLLVMRALPATLFLGYSLNMNHWFNLLKAKP